MPTNVTRYIYDGNLVLQERDGNNLPQVTYTRGTDLSGSLQDAGGIGGLLARTINPSTLNSQLLSFASAFYHADGNGNITALIYSNQTIAAKYEYDPFGNLLSKSGPLADVNLYRFSSQEYHNASDLVLFLRRMYDPPLQRFLNRDPIEETGGLNLYAYVHNDPLDRLDPLGLACRVKMSCSLIGTAPGVSYKIGPIKVSTKTCLYHCDKVLSKEDIKGLDGDSPIFCDQVPDNIQYYTDNQQWCSCDNPVTDVRVFGQVGLTLNCSKSKCRAGCAAIRQGEDKACDKSPYPKSCKAWAAMQEVLCDDGCNAICNQP